MCTAKTTNIKQIAIKCKLKKKKNKKWRKCALKSSMQVSFILYILCLILFKFSQRIKQRDTHRKKGACYRLFIFESRGVPVYPLFFHSTLPLLPFVSLCCGCCACFQAAEQQLQSSQTFPYILIHFYCHAQPLPPPARAKSNSHRAGGSFSLLFLVAWQSRQKKKGKTFSAQ